MNDHTQSKNRIDAVFAKATSGESKPSVPQWQTPREAAQYLRVSPKTLEHWRATGGGPMFCFAGRRRILYKAQWLDHWLEARAATSLAEAKRAGII